MCSCTNTQLCLQRESNVTFNYSTIDVNNLDNAIN